MRVGCPDCGRVFTDDDLDYCTCEIDTVALPTVADKLAFKLNVSGRRPEATAVLDGAAAMSNHGNVRGPLC